MQENSVIYKMVANDHTASAFQRGEAIEFELVDKHKNVICNRLCMGKSLSHLKHLPHVKCFLRKISRNHDFQRDSMKPTILMKRTKPNESFITNNDEQKNLQNKCKKLQLY
jgi:hypothetical protein